jgi:hypothetical protein
LFFLSSPLFFFLLQSFLQMLGVQFIFDSVAIADTPPGASIRHRGLLLRLSHRFQYSLCGSGLFNQMIFQRHCVHPGEMKVV